MLSRPSYLWWLTALDLIAFPAVNFIYWPQVLRSGALPSDGDSIGIPMFGSILATLVVSPLVLGVTWACLRRYNPKTSLWTWREDRPLRSIIITLLFGAVSVTLAASILVGLWLSPPWYEYLWRTYFGLWLPWLLAVRAAAVDQLDYEPSYTER